MSVVDFVKARADREETPHVGGEAICLACRHEWAAAAPVGTYQLDCPSCSCSKGVFKHPCAPPVGEMIRECNCGCRAFYVTPSGVHCWVCAQTQVFE